MSGLAAPDRPPNLIVVLVDDLDYGEMGVLRADADAYASGPVARSPLLAAYRPAPWPVPMRANLLAAAGYRSGPHWQVEQRVHPFDTGFAEFVGYLTQTKVEYPENSGGDVVSGPDVLLQQARRFLADHTDLPFCLGQHPADLHTHRSSTAFTGLSAGYQTVASRPTPCSAAVRRRGGRRVCTAVSLLGLAQRPVLITLRWQLDFLPVSDEIKRLW